MSAQTPVELPQDVTVPWETPEDVNLFWTPDLLHQPYPIAMIDYALNLRLYERSFAHGLAVYDVPLTFHTRRFWTFQYGAIEPRPMSSEEMEALGKSSEQKLMDAVAQLEERWETVWLPRVKAHIDYLESYPLQSATLDELMVHLDDTLARNDEMWDVHFEVVIPMMLAISLFDELYQELFHPKSQLRSYSLLQGIDNKTIEADRELWKLSRVARQSDSVRRIFEEYPPDQILAKLEAQPEAGPFMHALRQYLDDFGRRGDHWGVTFPTWRENPEIVLWNIRDYLAQPDRDPSLEQARLIAERDRLIADARERLSGHPEPVRNNFEFLLKAAQTGNRLTEDHGWWIDFRGAACVRDVFLELGRRFSSVGTLDQPDDIFHLTLDEVRSAAKSLASVRLQPLVQERKDELERYATFQPPPAVGTPPPGPPPDNALMRMLAKFFGDRPQASDDATIIRGASGSSGVARGRARVIRLLADASRLEPGDILVAPTTAPPWTPLFATAVAVVTDTGGVLSHCAVVAREYGIPAVVGTGVATSMIADGQMVEVDGDNGVVRLIGAHLSLAPAEVVPEVGPLPIPDDFPVAWQYPDDVHHTWTAERMHGPDPFTPLDFDIMEMAHTGFSRSFAHYGVPLAYYMRHINYYWYSTVLPTVTDMEAMPAMMEQGIRNIEDTSRYVHRLWTEEWLPEVEEHLTYWRTFDLRGASLPDLLAHLDETERRHKRVWYIHFLQTFPVYLAMSQFDDLYQDLFGTDNALDAYRLMQGFDNKTVEIGHEMWRLSRTVLASPDVRACFDTDDLTSVPAELERTADGRAFLADLHEFLNVYGRRGEKLGVGYPSWVEEPALAIRGIQEFVSQPDLDFDAETARLAAAREEAIAEARAAIAAYPVPVIDQFEAMLASAQQATVISEDHTFPIDFGEMYEVRRVFLEIGRRLVDAQVFDAIDDVFMLSIEEIRDTFRTLPDVRQHDVVTSRRAEMEHFRHVSPPPVIGTLRPAPPHRDAMARTIDKFFGVPPRPPEQSGDAVLLHGSPGSAGRATGTARVIRSLVDADRLEHGDILIAPTTAPAWTPLFATAGAVVTDTGGVLSHCAVVAREYGIPAVVGVGMATQVVRDGQTVEVDGDLGTVRVMS